MILGDAAHMDLLRNGEADLLITSPPYYPEDLSETLTQPRQQQRYTDAIRDRVLDHADCLRSRFEECARVLSVHGTLILQAKNLVYGGYEIRLVDHYVSQFEKLGLRTATTLYWRSMFAHPSKRAATCSLKVGAYRAPHAEQFVVLQRPGQKRTADDVDLPVEERDTLGSPLWTTPGEGSRARHPHQAPQSVIKRLIKLYSAPGDLVVDPFAGSGQTLETACRLGRSAVGYEIEPNRVQAFMARVEGQRG
jgi:site-specific DNA-methyltransferase (adenine-specific)